MNNHDMSDRCEQCGNVPNPDGSCACNPEGKEQCVERTLAELPKGGTSLEDIQARTTPSRENEVWVCGHTRKCGWKGRRDELVQVPDKDGFKIKSSTGTCPKCGNIEFYVRKT